MKRSRTILTLVTALAVGVPLAGISPALAVADRPVEEVKSASKSSSHSLGRPVIQALSEHRQGDKTRVSIKSIIPVKGAKGYRLEMYDPSTGNWVFQGKCRRVCTRIYSNSQVGSTMSFQMRALDSAGKIASLPSVAIGVTPKRWDPKVQPGTTLSINVGPMSAWVVGQAVGSVLDSLGGLCAVDATVRYSIRSMVKAAEAKAATNLYSAAAVTIASVAEAYYTAIYQNHCDVMIAIANSWEAAWQRVQAGENSTFRFETQWTAHKVQFAWWDTPVEIWICHLEIGPAAGVGLRLQTGFGESGWRECRFLTNRMWR